MSTFQTAERAQSELEKKKQELSLQYQKQASTDIQGRFDKSKIDVYEEKFKNSTVGLISKEDFAQKRANITSIVQTEYENRKAEQDRIKKELLLKKKKEQMKKINALSFQTEEIDELKEQITQKVKKIENTEVHSDNSAKKEQHPDSKIPEGGGEESKKKHKFGQNPGINTEFLADEQRDEEKMKLKEKMKQEIQEELQKKQTLIVELAYVFWDGTGNDFQMQSLAKRTILELLQKARAHLSQEYNWMKKNNANDLIFVAKETILPHNATLLDLIELKYQNHKNEILFDIQEILDQQDGSIFLRDFSNQVKILEKWKWERHKHIHPYSSWKVLDAPEFSKQQAIVQELSRIE